MPSDLLPALNLADISGKQSQTLTMHIILIQIFHATEKGKYPSLHFNLYFFSKLLKYRKVSLHEHKLFTGSW